MIALRVSTVENIIMKIVIFTLIKNVYCKAKTRTSKGSTAIFYTYFIKLGNKGNIEFKKYLLAQKLLWIMHTVK